MGRVVPWEAVTAMAPTPLATHTQLQGPPFGPGKLQDTWHEGAMTLAGGMTAPSHDPTSLVFPPVLTPSCPPEAWGLGSSLAH